VEDRPWYDKLLAILPDAYRTGAFILGLVVLGIFLFVRLRYGFDWDTTLTSWYFAFPCALALIVGGLVFLCRGGKLRRFHYFLDGGLFFGGVALGLFALNDATNYTYQMDYKFSRNVWEAYAAPQSFLESMASDKRKYVERKAYETQMEPVSDRAGGNLLLVVSVRDAGAGEPAGRACHIIRSRLEFWGSGPLEPSVTQLAGSTPEESDVHMWSLSKLRKSMRCVLRVVIGKTAKVDCRLLLEVKEE